MAPLKMYTMPISQPARAVSWACYGEGTEVEEIQTMPGKDTTKPEFRARHPIATVPQMDDDGFRLSEGHAILCYLGDKHNWKLYPKDAKTRARVHEYMNWHHQNTRRITIALFAPVMRPDIALPKPILDMWQKDITKDGGTLSTIERMLSSNKWLCGDVPTVADVSCYTEVGQCLDKFTGLFSVCGIDLSKYPKIQAWLAECEKLPGFEKSHATLAKMGPMVKKKAAELKSKL